MSSGSVADALNASLILEGETKHRMVATTLLVKGGTIAFMGNGKYRSDLFESICNVELSRLNKEPKVNLTSNASKSGDTIQYVHVKCAACKVWHVHGKAGPGDDKWTITKINLEHAEDCAGGGRVRQPSAKKQVAHFAEAVATASTPQALMKTTSAAGVQLSSSSAFRMAGYGEKTSDSLLQIYQFAKLPEA